MDNSKVKFDVVPNINIDLAKKLNNYDFVQKIQKHLTHNVSHLHIMLLKVSLYYM
jgi:hypothetical protein